MATSTTSLMDTAQKLATDNAVNPFTQTYDESKGVAGRVTDLINTNSPLMQTAATTGAQQAAQRGLLNSSIGVQAGQQAVINSATPIATSDASLSTQTSLANLAAKNQAAIANSNNAVTAGSTALQLGNSNEQQSAALGEQGREADQTAANQKASLDLQSKQIDAQIDQFAQNLGLNKDTLQLQRDQLSSSDKNALASLELQKTQLAQQQSQFDASQTTNQSNFAAEMAQKDTQFASAQTQAVVLQKMDEDSKAQLQALSTANQADISSSTNIANAWGSMLSGINNIQNNASLDQPAKETLINNVMGAFQSYTSFWKKAGGTDAPDVSDLLNFNIVNSGGAAATTPAATTPVQTTLPGSGDFEGRGQ